MRLLTWGAALITALAVEPVAATFGNNDGCNNWDACALAVRLNWNGKADCQKYMTQTVVAPTK